MRDALREARDREAMLTIAALMLSEVEKAAGAERAESLRERIDRLLPPAESCTEPKPRPARSTTLARVRREPRTTGPPKAQGIPERSGKRTDKAPVNTGVSLLERGRRTHGATAHRRSKPRSWGESLR
jgi:hypothetical protein